MADAHGFGRRIKRAMLAYASQIGRQVSAREWGELVAAEQGRGQPYSSGTVGDWIAERSEPSLGAFVAMSRVLARKKISLPPGVLAFGRGGVEVRVYTPAGGQVAQEEEATTERGQKPASSA